MQNYKPPTRIKRITNKQPKKIKRWIKYGESYNDYAPKKQEKQTVEKCNGKGGENGGGDDNDDCGDGDDDGE